MATRIDSPSNPRIVAAIKAVGAHEKMLLEGGRMIEEALDAGVLVEEIFASDISRMSGVKGALRAPHSGQGPLTPDIREQDFLLSGLLQQPRTSERILPGRLHRQPPHIRDNSSPRVTEVSPRVLRKLSDLPSTRGAVGIAAPPRSNLDSLSDLYSRTTDVEGRRPLRGARSAALTSAVRERDSHLPADASAAAAYEKKSSSSSPLLFLLLDDVQDPANVGAILRSGEAFGVAGAVLTPGCAWPFSPRALRASGGSAFRLPVVARVASDEAVAWARRHGVVLAGAVAHGGAAPEVLVGVRPLALVIGSEGHGISAGIDASLDHRVTLPLAGRVDSLNAAVAAGVLLHVLSRPPAPAR